MRIPRFFLVLTVLIVAGVTMSVNHVAAQSLGQFFTLDSDALVLDAQTAERGYVHSLFDGQVSMTMPARAFSGAATIDYRKLLVADPVAYPHPYGFTPVSTVFEYAIRDQLVYTGNPLTLEVRYWSATDFPKRVFYYNEVQGVWRMLDAVIHEETSTARVLLRMPVAQIAVYEFTGIMQTGRASWYRFRGCDCTASPDYPKGTQLRVTNLETGQSLIVTVNDWGPERDIFPDRVIDLDATAFAKLGRTTAGTIPVSVVPVRSVGLAYSP